MGLQERQNSHGMWHICGRLACRTVGEAHASIIRALYTVAAGSIWILYPTGDYLIVHVCQVAHRARDMSHGVIW